MLNLTVNGYIYFGALLGICLIGMAWSAMMTRRYKWLTTPRDSRGLPPGDRIVNAETDTED